MEFKYDKRQAPHGEHRRVRLATTALGLVLAFGAAGQALAQSDATAPASPSADNSNATPSPTAPASGETKAKARASSDSNTVVVTATGTNIAGIKPVGSESVAISRDQALSSGYTDVAQIVETLPEVQDSMSVGGSNPQISPNITAATSLNLRGLGPQATLTLVDGHRVAPTGAPDTYTEASQVPVAALQSIQVIPDGASAIYGSDAVGGVVNYVLRKDYDGVEMTARDTANRYYNEWGLSITAGKTWSHLGPLGAGNIIVSYDYDDHGAMLEYASPYLRQNLTPLGGLDFRVNGETISVPATPGNIVELGNSPNPAFPLAGDYVYYGVPVGTTGVGLTVNNLLLNQPNLQDASKYTDFQPKSTKHQAAMFFNQELTPWLSMYFEGFLTDRKSITEEPGTGGGAGTDYVLQSSSPYFVAGVPNTTACNPPENTALQCETFQYNFVHSIGPGNTTNTDLTYTTTLGLKASLPYSWNADLYYTYGADFACGVCNYGNNVDPNAFQAQIDAGNINPFSATPLTKAEIATFTGNNLQESGNVLDHVALNLSGPVFSLPGGQVKAAIGAEYIHDSDSLRNGAERGPDNIFQWDNVTKLSRADTAVYGEVFVPVVGPDNAVPFMKSLNLDGAVRYDSYSDAGNTTNPKIGVTWTVSDDLALRASWGTSFRAPSLTDINPEVFSLTLETLLPNFSGNPKIPATNGLSNVIFLLGPNPDLKPETATTWSAGVDFTPHQISGLKLSATYYNINYQNEITSVGQLPFGAFLISPANAAAYAKYIIPTPETAGCVNGQASTYNPVLIPYLDAPNLYGPPIFTPCAIEAVLDGRQQNAASTFQDGLDFSAVYRIPSSFGTWTVGGNLTYILDNTEQLATTAPKFSALNVINYPISLRGRANVGWSDGPWSVNLFVNYVGGYLNNLTEVVNGTQLPFQHVAAWVTVDAGISYAVPKDADQTWLRGVRASINVQNIFNANPPTVLSTDGFGYDSSAANVFGAVYQFQLTKAF